MMGCDIHCYAEKKIDGKWTLIGSASREEPEDDEPVGRLDVSRFYRGRNYYLFAILADVRNGRGFAGVKTGSGFNPIADPRGLPADVCGEIAEVSERLGIDGHSHSYHTLRDLLDFDWTQTSKLQGWCNAVEWATWSRWSRGEGKGPDGYCGGVSGGGVKHISAEDMEKLLEPVAKIYSHEREDFAKQHANTYALAEWTETYAEAAGTEFFIGTITRLLKEAGGVAGADDVRIVFFFDN